LYTVSILSITFASTSNDFIIFSFHVLAVAEFWQTSVLKAQIVAKINDRTIAF
jgi:hypothetical protein